MMKAISLWQPWASLIACGAKPFETRHWAPPRDLIGTTIAIHAAKKIDRGAVEFAEALMYGQHAPGWCRGQPCHGDLLLKAANRRRRAAR